MNQKRARQLRAIAKHFKKTKKATYRGYLGLSHQDKFTFVFNALHMILRKGRT